MKRGLLLAVLAAFLISVPAVAGALTVQEVASELECPCECPLVLEDCNMSCGLDWKEQIGAEIKAGKTKEEIIAGFVAKYGEACRITPARRIKGKVYQYTRGFGTLEWALVGAGAFLWAAAVFFGVFLVIRRLSVGKDRGKKG